MKSPQSAALICSTQGYGCLDPKYDAPVLTGLNSPKRLDGAKYKGPHSAAEVEEYPCWPLLR